MFSISYTTGINEFPNVTMTRMSFDYWVSHSMFSCDNKYEWYMNNSVSADVC